MHKAVRTFTRNPARAIGMSDRGELAANAMVRDCRFGRYTQVGEQTRMDDFLLDDYSYIQQNCDLASTDIGKFSNIAAMVRVNPGFNPMEYPTLHHLTYRPTIPGIQC